MDLDIIFFHFGLFIISFIANSLSALAGGGAGLLQLPALILMGLPFPSALATHKIASVALGLGAISRHISNKNLRLDLALFILFCGVPAVALGAAFVLTLPGKIFTMMLAILTIICGVYSFLKKDLGIQTININKSPMLYIVGGLVLFLIGALNGSLSSGTGLFVTLWLIYWFGLDYKTAVAYTLIIVGFFWNGTGALILGSYGQIAWKFMPMLFLGSIIGGAYGSHLSIVKGSHIVKRLFELMTVSVGISMLIKTLY